jgi:hypothetical protein
VSGDLGRCVKDRICAQSPKGSNLILNPDKEGTMGDRASLTCPEGYARFEIQLTEGDSSEMKVVCGDEGWKWEKNNFAPLPVCKKGM